jgi:hypothetical protein
MTAMPVPAVSRRLGNMPSTCDPAWVKTEEVDGPAHKLPAKKMGRRDKCTYDAAEELEINTRENGC